MKNTHSPHQPIGLQLYTVGAEMDADPLGTLRRIAAIGYRDVELSPLGKTPPKDLLAAIQEAGLTSLSAHYMLPDLMANLQEKIDLAKQFGQEYMVVTVPWVADPSRIKSDPEGGQMSFFLTLIHSLTLDDWKWNAEQFNKVGEQIKRAGLHLAYHNHNFEWKRYGDVSGYDELLRLTDPELVKLELDCGWATVAGEDPIAYLNRYPDRYRLLHLKDFRNGFTVRTKLLDEDAGAPAPTELGRGGIDYSRIFSAAENLPMRALYVEQEPPFTEMPALQAIQVSYEYVKDCQGRAKERD